jgi:transcription antitermination protein NusB
MGARTAAREAALQMLYAAEFGRPEAETLIGDFWREFPGDAEDRSYADGAVRGVLEERSELDKHLVQASANWRIERMNPIARNVLRLGTWELLRHPEIPRAVIIDESVEVAKRYAGTESGAFVNGVLDRIADDCGRKNEPKGYAARIVSAPAEAEADSPLEEGFEPGEAPDAPPPSGSASQPEQDPATDDDDF